MAMTGELDWVFWTLGGLLGLAGLALAWWALFADRAKGRKRCPKCWYDLTGSPGPTCSECGYGPKSEAKLFKTRRHWRWAVVAVLVLVGSAASGMTPKIKREGWISVVPTTVLILSLPWVDDPELILLSELDRRLPSPYWPQGAHPPDWSDWQWRLLIDRCLAGDARRKPATPEWYSFYGYLLDAPLINGRILENDELRAQLAATFPMEVVIEPKERSVSNDWVTFRMDMRPRFGRSIEYRATAQPVNSEGAAMSAEWFSNWCGVGQAFIGHDQTSIRIDPTQEAIVFRVTVDCRLFATEGQWQQFSSLEMSVPIARRSDHDHELESKGATSILPAMN